MQLYLLFAMLLWLGAAVAYVDRNATERHEAKNLRYSLKVKDESIDTVTRVSAEKEADAAAREDVLEDKLAQLARIHMEREAAMAAMLERPDPPSCDVPEPRCEIPKEIIELLQQP